MKMMQLMVNRRQVPDKKTSLVNESLNDGLATFALDRHESDFRKPQQILKHPPRGSYRYSEPDSLPSPRNFGDEAVRLKDFEANSTKEPNGDCEDGVSQRKINRRHRRAASLHSKQQKNILLGPTLTSSLSIKENRLGDGIPEKLTADDSTGKFAYMSLDGRLINAELATSVTSIGGRLGDEEAQAWEDFAPMQRVLIVAVSAAAAAAAKHRNRKEIDLLLKTVENREKELVLLRKELSDLCKKSHTNASQIHPERLQLLENLAVRSSPPKTPVQREFAAMRKCNFDRDNSKVKLDLHEAWSSTKPAPVCARPAESELRGGDVNERGLSRDSPVNKDVVFMESTNLMPCKGESLFSCAVPGGDEAWAKEEAKWYVNPMVETSQDFYDISTPERANSMFSVCNPAVQGSFEWTVLRSTFANRGTDLVGEVRLPLIESPAPVQTTVSNWSSYHPRSKMVNEGALHEEHNAMRAVCAAVVLDLRERVLAVLDKEASMVMAALDNSVEDAKTQIASMHLGVASCWNASVPKALAALSLSPSEFDSYLNETQVAVMERQMKKLEQDVAGNGGKPICKLAACVERDLKNQVKCREDVADLVRQLQSKEVEVADLKKGQQALLDSKNKEIEELKEEHKRRDAELDKQLAPAETTKAASADRLAMLEELCKQKDYTQAYLKQDLQSLETKVHGSRVYQSPAVPRARRNFTSSTPSSSSGYGTSQKQRFSEKRAPPSCGGDPILEHIGRFRREVPSNRGHYRNLPYINTQSHEELTDDGRSEQGNDQETSQEYNSSPPGSTIGDDCSVNSLALSETELESRVRSEYCSSGEDSRYRSSKDRLSGTKGSSYNRTLQKQKSASSDLRRVVTSTASSDRGFTRVPSKITSSATSVSKPLSGEKHSIKTLNRTLSDEYMKVTKDPNSPRISNLKAQGIVAANSASNHRRSSSLDMNFKSNICSILETSGLSGGSLDGGSLHSHETSAIKRKRWV